MSDTMRIDSHKLLFHPQRVTAFLNNENIMPIYMEVSPIGSCNHRCVFCGLDFMGYKPKKIDQIIFKERLNEMAKNGLKSIMYAGEGEPLLHKDFCQMVKDTKEANIDVSITSNGVLLTPERSAMLLPLCSWIKISFNAGKAETYSKIHRTKAEDFKTTIENLSYAAEFKKKHNLDCTLGMQMVLLPDNSNEVEDFVKIGRDIGIDYVVIKPYSQHPLSETKLYEEVEYSYQEELANKIQQYSTDNFSVIFRANSMKRWDNKCKSYEKCLALPFWSYIDASGNVWGCSMFLGDEKFCYGNINDSTFMEIWNGSRRKKSLEYVATEMDSSKCRINCRMDAINEYLDELKHPKKHVNFI